MARSLSRLGLGRGGPRDLGAIRAGLLAGEDICALFATVREPLDGPPAEIAQALNALTLSNNPALGTLLRTLAKASTSNCPPWYATAA